MLPVRRLACEAGAGVEGVAVERVVVERVVGECAVVECPMVEPAGWVVAEGGSRPQSWRRCYGQLWMTRL